MKELYGMFSFLDVTHCLNCTSYRSIGQNSLKWPRNEPNRTPFFVLETKNLQFWMY